MSFGREKRLLLGWLAALAPLPLPFSDVLEWSFTLAYWLAVAVFLYRAAEGAEEWLPTWALNVIGLGIHDLPVPTVIRIINGRGAKNVPGKDAKK